MYDTGPRRVIEQQTLPRASILSLPSLRLTTLCCVVLCHAVSQMMRCEVTKYNKRFGIVKMSAKGYVGTDLAVEAELTLAMGKAS